MYILHDFFRSSASFRTRIALNLKGVEYTQKSYKLREGEQRSEEYLALNNQGLVPALQLEDGTTIPQSLAIIEYLDRKHPQPRLIPDGDLDAAHVRALAYRVACDIHPINNLRVLNYLQDPFGHSADDVAQWFRHWMTTEFDSLEKTLAADPRTGKFCFGDAPGLADICLIPQVINGRRFDVPEDSYPTIMRIFKAAMDLPAFDKAAPMKQPDAF